MVQTHIKTLGIGWVLGDGTGCGVDNLSQERRLSLREHAVDGALAGFNPKPYLTTVKGYLDPASAYCLAAGSLALSEVGIGDPTGSNLKAGICTATYYGAPTSGFRFFTQLIQKGPRLASPLVFPHSYSNTAGNLAAIEFGFAGPHMVFYGRQSIAELFEFAFTRFEQGEVTDMLVGAYEADCREALPDDVKTVNGAVMLYLSSQPKQKDLLPDLFRSREAMRTALDRCSAKSPYGSVDALLSLF